MRSASALSTKSTSIGNDVMALSRVLSLTTEVASVSEVSFQCYASCGLLHPVMTLNLRSDGDLLLQLNALELLPSLARVPSGCAALFGGLTANYVDEEGVRDDAPFSILLRNAASNDPCLTCPSIKAMHLIVQRTSSHLEQKTCLPWMCSTETFGTNV